ncbi:alpha/beta hydrolase [Streptomyces sp. NPDC051994]|uniref:alpha/beta fold hydrolase n=1 Tax=unclassified Streptomyces TaxID=2593676 RepID=UPI00343ADAFA
MTSTVHALTLPAGSLDVTVEDRGQGRVVLLLHGGGGPQTVASFAQLMAEQRQFRIITPVHPGFAGTPRPDWLTDVAGLAEAYAALLDELGLTDVTVVGNSMGGWIAAELALRAGDRISGMVLVNAVGIHVPGHPVADTFSLTPAELSRLSFHDPAKSPVPAAPTDAQRAAVAANRAALTVYAGPHAMADPTLRERLAKVEPPVLVAWGESDQVVDSAYGRAWATAIPGARFELLHRTGHLPQIETPDQLLAVVGHFADLYATGGSHR